jgi:hypothetical protein
MKVLERGKCRVSRSHCCCYCICWPSLLLTGLQHRVGWCMYPAGVLSRERSSRKSSHPRRSFLALSSQLVWNSANPRPLPSPVLVHKPPEEGASIILRRCILPLAASESLLLFTHLISVRPVVIRLTGRDRRYSSQYCIATARPRLLSAHIHRIIHPSW